MSKKLYVGNLPRDANEALLRMAFSAHGREVESVEIVVDEVTGRPRGYAYLGMASEEDLWEAVAAMDGSDLDGRTLEVHAIGEE